MRIAQFDCIPGLKHFGQVTPSAYRGTFEERGRSRDPVSDLKSRYGPKLELVVASSAHDHLNSNETLHLWSGQ